MPTITFDVPEKLARQIAALPEAERNVLATELFQDALSDEETPDPGLSDSDHAAIQRGLSDLDAGRVVDSDTFFADLYAKVGLPKPPPFSETVNEERKRIKAARKTGQPYK